MSRQLIGNGQATRVEPCGVCLGNCPLMNDRKTCHFGGPYIGYQDSVGKSLNINLENKSNGIVEVV